MKKILIILLAFSFTTELEVQGNLNVTDTLIVTNIQSATIDSLLSLIAQLEQRIAQLECQNTGIIPDGYCDCFFHTLDECGVCNGDNTICADCAGVPNGDSLLDMCGYCDNDSSNDCVQDCFGEWGGIAEYDICGDCGGDAISEEDCNPTDIDGNSYETIQIGEQLWMAENLRTNLIGSNCYGDEIDNCEIYGRLYQWDALNVNNICPEEWHVPTDDEWKDLEIFLGMTAEAADGNGFRGTNQGSQLAGSSYLWDGGGLVDNPEFGTSGFNALPGGHNTGSSDVHIDNSAYFWTSSPVSSNRAWARHLAYNNSGFYRGDWWQNSDKFSVRCIQD